MPFVRISLRFGKSPEYLQTLADHIHAALTETFDVPADDRFQVIYQHDAAEFSYDPASFGVQRSGDLVFIASPLDANVPAPNRPFTAG